MFSKDDPAINEHHYNMYFFNQIINNKQYIEEAHHIHNIEQPTTCNIKNTRYTDEQFYNKSRHIHNTITNNISNTHITHNNKHMLKLGDNLF